MNPFTNNSKVVAEPELPEFPDLVKLTKNELVEEKRLQTHLSVARNQNISRAENEKVRSEAQRKLNFVIHLLQTIQAEEDQAKKLADRNYMEKAVSENLCDIRICVNPSSMANAIPYGITLELLKWEKPTSEVFTFKAIIGYEERGHNLTRVESFQFNLLSIPADTFRRMVSNPFKHESFRVGKQTLYIMVV